MENINQEQIRALYWQHWEQTQTDPEYARLFAQMADLEPRFESVMERLNETDEDIVRDYVALCEDMSRRMLECAIGRLLSK